MDKKENRLLNIMLVTVLVIMLFIININKIFPNPDIDLSSLDQFANFTISRSNQGTSPGAPVTLIEFSDFECPYCQNAHEIVKELLSKYGNKINYLYKHYPTHENSAFMAVASECANEQGAFLEYADELFRVSTVNADSLIGIAQTLELDTERFVECLSNPLKTDLVQQDLSEGVFLGIRGTPTFYINNQKIEGALEVKQFEEIIDSFLEDE